MATERLSALLHFVGLLGAGGLIAAGLFLSKPDTQTQTVEVPTDPPDRIVELWVPKPVQLIAANSGQLLKDCSQVSLWIKGQYSGILNGDSAGDALNRFSDYDWSTIPCLLPN